MRFRINTHLVAGPFILRLSTKEEREESRSPLISLAGAWPPTAEEGTTGPPPSREAPEAPPSGFRMSPKPSKSVQNKCPVNGRRYYFITRPRTTLSQDVQTRSSVQLAFAKFLSKIKGNFNIVPVSWIQHSLKNFPLF